MTDYSTRMAPPVDPAAGQAPQRATTWPIVVGVIAIIVAAFGILGGCGGLATPLILRFAEGVIEQGGGSGAPESQAAALKGMERYTPALVVGGLLGMVAGGILLVGGIGVLRRTASSPRLLFWWSVVKVPLVLYDAVVSYLVNAAQFEAMQSDPQFQQAGAAVGSSMEIMAVGGAVLTLAFGLALPVFLLVWLSRAKIRAETAAWPPPPAPA